VASYLDALHAAGVAGAVLWVINWIVIHVVYLIIFTCIIVPLTQRDAVTATRRAKQSPRSKAVGSREFIYDKPVRIF
jgi:hypothetical protein